MTESAGGRGDARLGRWGKGSGPIDLDLSIKGDLFADDPEAEKAKRDAFRLLGRRAYTRREVSEKLLGRGYVPEVVTSVIETLERLDLIDDRKFAAAFIRDREKLRPSGPALIRRDLARRGVPGELIEEAIRESFGDADLTDAAFELLRGRQSRYLGLDKLKALRRMQSFLARRGFSSDVARAATSRAWDFFDQQRPS